MRYVVIMAGGSGTRLWPLSKQGMPKQLLEIFGGKSMLRLAYERLNGLIPDAQILTCTNRAYADEVARQLPELPSDNILGEPVGRDSLGAVAWSSAALAERDPAAVVAMVTADQIIRPVEAFRNSLDQAFQVAETREEAIVTLGVVPTSPHTGYGYLHRGEQIAEGVYRIQEFKEKPSADVAQRYLAVGEYWWNAGMFVFQAETLLQQLDQLQPDVSDAVRRIAADPTQLDDIFPTMRKISVDYAIMEPVSQGQGSAEIYGVGLEVEWRDVGGYISLAEEFSSDAEGNHVDGRAVNIESSGCIVVNTIGSDHLVATLGLADTLVVAAPSATLVTPLTETERIKELVDLVRTAHGAEFA